MDGPTSLPVGQGTENRRTVKDLFSHLSEGKSMGKRYVLYLCFRQDEEDEVDIKQERTTREESTVERTTREDPTIKNEPPLIISAQFQSSDNVTTSKRHRASLSTDFLRTITSKKICSEDPFSDVDSIEFPEISDIPRTVNTEQEPELQLLSPHRTTSKEQEEEEYSGPAFGTRQAAMKKALKGRTVS